VVIVSSSGAEVVAPIGAMLGADRVVATRMAVVDGVFTGDIEQYVYGPAKAEAMRGLAAEEGYDLAASYAYSDSVTDLPMLEAVGHPHAVNPDRALRRAALTRGWPVLDFSRPVPLRRRLGRIPVPTAGEAAAAVGAGAATAGLAWYARRRRNRRPLPFSDGQE
jgi:phosphoserine phosphatase